MSRKPPALWRALKAVLWFVVRLIAFALTGTWLGTGRNEEERQQAADRPDPLVGRPHAEPERPLVPSGRAVTHEGGLGALDERLAVIEAQARQLRRPGNVVAACAATRTDVQRLKQTPRAERAEPEHREHARSLTAAVAYLEAVVEQRADAGLGDWLSDVDRLASDTIAPVVELLHSHGETETRHWVSRAGAGAHGLEALSASRVGALGVQHGVAQAPDRWPLMVPQVARSLLFDVPGLADEIYRKHRLPAGVALPHGHVGYGPDELHGAQGVWLETLFADVFCTLRLGPAYARALSHALAEPEQPMRAVVVTARGSWLSPWPPPAVRVHACMRALAELGQHQARASLWDQWVSQHGEPEVFLFPTQDGAYNAVPASYVLGQTDQLLHTLTRAPLDALYGYAFTEIPDLAYGHADAANQEHVQARLRQGRAERHAPYVILAAAADAVAVDGAERVTVAAAARRELGFGEARSSPATDLRTVEVGVDVPGSAAAFRPKRPDVRTLRRALRSPAVLRDAVLLDSVLGTPGLHVRWPKQRRS